MCSVKLLTNKQRRGEKWAKSHLDSFKHPGGDGQASFLMLPWGIGHRQCPLGLSQQRAGPCRSTMGNHLAANPTPACSPFLSAPCSLLDSQVRGPCSFLSVPAAPAQGLGRRRELDELCGHQSEISVPSLKERAVLARKQVCPK